MDKGIYCEVTKEEYFDLRDELSKIPNEKFETNGVKIYESDRFDTMGLSYNDDIMPILYVRHSYSGEIKYFFLINWELVTVDNFDDMNLNRKYIEKKDKITITIKF